MEAGIEVVGALQKLTHHSRDEPFTLQQPEATRRRGPRKLHHKAKEQLIKGEKDSSGAAGT